MTRDWRSALLDEGASLLEAIKVIDASRIGIAIVTDQGGVLKGVLTDYDFRRATLSGAALESPITEFVNREPVVASESMDDDEILMLMQEAHRLQLPVVDGSHKVTGVRFLGDLLGTLPLSVPHLEGNEWHYVKDCLDTNWVSSVGPYVDRFERETASLLNVKHAVACVSGTAALHVSYLLAGMRPGTEALVPALTFVATINAVAYCGARPVFVDADKGTLGICPRSLRGFLETGAEKKADGYTYNKVSGARITAVVVVHVFGLPAALDEIVEICREWNLVLVEDAAESLGSTYRGRHTGTFGRLGCLSFNGNKIITTGGGGMIVTDDDELAARARHLTTQAKSDSFHFVHDEIGFNYRLSNILAAVGVAQLEKLDQYIERKRGIASAYAEILSDIPGVRVVTEQPNTRSNYWLTSVEVDANQKEGLLRELNAQGIQARPIWTLNSAQQMFKDCQTADLRVAKEVYKTTFNLPSSVNIKNSEIELVGHIIRETVKNGNLIES